MPVAACIQGQNRQKIFRHDSDCIHFVKQSACSGGTPETPKKRFCEPDTLPPRPARWSTLHGFKINFKPVHRSPFVRGVTAGRSANEPCECERVRITAQRTLDDMPGKKLVMGDGSRSGPSL